MTRTGLFHCACVGLGGLTGSVLRHLAQSFVVRVAGSAFPWGTLAVNAVGCLAIGCVAGWSMTHDALGTATRLFLVTGLFGGFTTYSAFGAETFELLRSGSYTAAAANVAAQLLGGLIAVGLGFVLGKLL